MTLKVYGCRGSVPTSRVGGSRYGGNTSCIKLTSNGESIMLDAGSGLMTLRDELQGKPLQRINMLISHLHLDHIMGLGTFDHAWNQDAGVKIFTLSRDERPIAEQIGTIFAPPYWPVSLKDSPAFEIVEIHNYVSFKIGVFTITPFASNHPNDTTSFRITDGKKTIVHLLDNETPTMNDEGADMTADYCRNTDLVVFDAAYSSVDYPQRKGWGHSTVAHGIELTKKWGCEKMLFAHFDPKYSDEELDTWKELFTGDNFIMAYDGLEMNI